MQIFNKNKYLSYNLHSFQTKVSVFCTRWFAIRLFMHQICQHDNCLNFSWYAERLFVCALGEHKSRRDHFRPWGTCWQEKDNSEGSRDKQIQVQKHKNTNIQVYFLLYTHLTLIYDYNYCKDPYQVISISISIIVVYHVAVHCCPRSKGEKKVFLSEEKV